MGKTKGKTEKEKPKTKEKVVRKKKAKEQITFGIARIQSTFNNTLITITDRAGNVLSWSSAGSSGFKGSRKSTPYASQIAAEIAARKAKEYGVSKVDVYVKGIGSGREAAIRSLQSSGIYINSIRDITGIPHNGCRPKKPRRV